MDVQPIPGKSHARKDEIRGIFILVNEYGYLGLDQHYLKMRPGVKRVLHATESLHLFQIACYTSASEAQA